MRVVGLLLACFFVYVCYCNGGFDPYRVLNVPKNAKLAEIRKSYKKLVKKWHPDKNRSPDAQDNFIKIQQAYEILSNDEKRNQYDQQGFSSSSGTHQQWNQPKNFRYSDFFSNDFYDFGFDDATSSRSVSNHKFFQQVIPDSHHTPQILYVYSTFCARCIAILKTSWERAAKDLEKLGIGVGTVDTTFSSRISSYLRVYSLPTVVLIFADEYSYYRGMISYENIKRFITTNMPQSVQSITAKNLDSFLQGVNYDDKPRSLLFSRQPDPTLLYVLMSIKHSKYIKFGFVSLSNSNSKAIAEKYGVRGFGPTLLIFKEDIQSPAVSLQSSDMPRGAVNDILTTHRYMVVPRLTTQEVFDDVCPPPGDQTFHVSLCAIYVTSDKRSVHESALNSLRRLVASSSESDEQLADWLKFVFVMDYKQQSFVKSLRDEEEAPVKSEFLLLWRRGKFRAFVSTFSSEFLESENTQEYGFQKFLAACMQSAHQRQFERKVQLTRLNDELAPFLLTRLVMKGWKTAVSTLGYFRSFNEQELMLGLVTVVVVVLSLISFVKNLFGIQTEDRRRAPTSSSSRYEEEEDTDVEVDVAFSDDEETDDGNKNENSKNIDLLNPSSYDDLILHQKRGQLTIVLLLHQDDQVLDDFKKIAYLYQRDLRLRFCCLRTTSYIGWYVELRKASSAQPPTTRDRIPASGLSSLHSNSKSSETSGGSEVEMTPEAVHGTVLACNGSKHWYCIFVPRVGRRHFDSRTLDSTSDVLGYGDGQNSPIPPLESGDSKSSTLEAEAPKFDDLMLISEYYTTLVNWMDRVCEGQLPRLYVRQWPGLYTRSSDTSDDEV